MLIPLGWLSGSAGGGGAIGPFEQISTTILGAATASITFSSIPSTYKHLQIRATIRATSTGTATGLVMRLNGDTAGNYAFHNLVGNGTSVTSGSFTTQTSMTIGIGHDDGSVANSFGANIVDILDYASTSKNKTIKGFGGIVPSVTQVRLSSGLWMSTVAVNSITLIPDSNNWSIGSRFSLYGIKG